MASDFDMFYLRPSYFQGDFTMWPDERRRYRYDETPKERRQRLTEAKQKWLDSLGKRHSGRR